MARGDLKRGSTPASGNLSKHKSRSALRRHHDAHEIGRVPRPELLHDVGAVIFDRARLIPSVRPASLWRRRR